MTTDRFLTADELAARYRKSVRTIYDWRLRGVGPKPTKVGGRLLYHEDAVEEYERGLTAA